MDISFDYCLMSSESYIFKSPRKCWLIKRLKSEDRNDLALIKIDPPAVYRNSATQTEQILYEIIVAPRFEKMDIFQPKEWPIYVYIATTNKKIEADQKFLKNEDIHLIAWGELYSSDFFNKKSNN